MLRKFFSKLNIFKRIKKLEEKIKKLEGLIESKSHTPDADGDGVSIQQIVDEWLNGDSNDE